jgi:hypothetical protein
MFHRPKVPLSVEHGPSALVPVHQVRQAAAHLGHLQRLSVRMMAAAEGGDELALSESEALLLLAELRRLGGQSEERLDDLVETLIDRLPRDTEAHLARFGLRPR